MKLDDKMDKLGVYSVQCDACLHCNCEGLYLCWIYGNTPEKYWLNEEKCPSFEKKPVE